jgi:ornithine--oxo-acid transaminase
MGYEVKGVRDGQAEIIVCADNFHGRTLGIIGFSTDAAAREHFGPFAPGFRTIPFGNAKALEEAITLNTVAFLVEPIQGEAGVIIPPPGYFTKVRELCTAHDVMLVLDEIQTGLGRTGKLLAEQHEGIEADVTLLGKALSGGFYPVSAVLFSQAPSGDANRENNSAQLIRARFQQPMPIADFMPCDTIGATNNWI